MIIFWRVSLHLRVGGRRSFFLTLVCSFCIRLATTNMPLAWMFSSGTYQLAMDALENKKLSSHPSQHFQIEFHWHWQFLCVFAFSLCVCVCFVLFCFVVLFCFWYVYERERERECVCVCVHVWLLLCLSVAVWGVHQPLHASYLWIFILFSVTTFTLLPAFTDTPSCHSDTPGALLAISHCNHSFIDWTVSFLVVIFGLLQNSYALVSNMDSSSEWVSKVLEASKKPGTVVATTSVVLGDVASPFSLYSLGLTVAQQQLCLLTMKWFHCRSLLLKEREI